MQKHFSKLVPVANNRLVISNFIYAVKSTRSRFLHVSNRCYDGRTVDAIFKSHKFRLRCRQQEHNFSTIPLLENDFVSVSEESHVKFSFESNFHSSDKKVDIYSVQEGGYVDILQHDIDKYLPEGISGELAEEFDFSCRTALMVRDVDKLLCRIIEEFDSRKLETPTTPPKSFRQKIDLPDLTDRPEWSNATIRVQYYGNDLCSNFSNIREETDHDEANNKNLDSETLQDTNNKTKFSTSSSNHKNTEEDNKNKKSSSNNNNNTDRKKMYSIVSGTGSIVEHCIEGLKSKGFPTQYLLSGTISTCHNYPKYDYFVVVRPQRCGEVRSTVLCCHPCSKEGLASLVCT